MTNVIDNAFLNQERAGKEVAEAQQEAGRAVLAIAIETIRKEVKTPEDGKAFLKGYADQIATTNKDSVKTLKSRMARIVKVMLASDIKLNEFHKLTKPADGQKLVAKLAKKCDGLAPMYHALAIPSAGKADGAETEAESESSEPTDKDKRSLAEIMSDAIKEARANGYTTTEIMDALATSSLELAA